MPFAQHNAIAIWVLSPIRLDIRGMKIERRQYFAYGKRAARMSRLPLVQYPNHIPAECVAQPFQLSAFFSRDCHAFS
ncbi:hypothetical protein SDC9_189854 [bioreactor metagenome]|uniref:Uncharacterized protein n=1 Tax=bioreactor metagenome TaxID=1076179 RepID=A0A645HTK6_9ZZZZ